MIPPLRFPGFEGEWQLKHGDDAFKSRRMRAKEGLPLYSVTMDQGMVRRDSLEREFSSNSPDEANLRVFKGDQVYNMMRMWQGAVGRAPEDCMVSPAYVVLEPRPDTVSAFFDHWFKRRRSLYLLWAYSYGLTNDRLRLYARDFGRVPMTLPIADEQRKIAEFLGSIDERVKLLQRRQHALARYKSCMVQALFRQALRFHRDDGTAFPDWTEHQLGDVAVVEMGQSPDSTSYNQEGSGVPLIQGNADIVDGISAPRRFTTQPTKFCKPNDVLLSVRAPIGAVSRASQEACIGRGIAALRGRQGNSTEYVYQYLLHYEPRWVALGQGSTFTALSGPDIRGVRLMMPSPDEQQKIAGFLGALDTKIGSVSSQIYQTRLFKRAMLEQMFV